MKKERKKVNEWQKSKSITTWQDDVYSVGFDFVVAHWHNGQPSADLANPTSVGHCIPQENGGHWSLHSQMSQLNKSFKYPDGQFFVHWSIDGHDWHSHRRQPFESVR